MKKKKVPDVITDEAKEVDAELWDSLYALNESCINKFNISVLLNRAAVEYSCNILRGEKSFVAKAKSLAIIIQACTTEAIPFAGNDVRESLEMIEKSIMKPDWDDEKRHGVEIVFKELYNFPEHK